MAALGEADHCTLQDNDIVIMLVKSAQEKQTAFICFAVGW